MIQLKRLKIYPEFFNKTTVYYYFSKKNWSNTVHAVLNQFLYKTNTIL